MRDYARQLININEVNESDGLCLWRNATGAGSLSHRPGQPRSADDMLLGRFVLLLLDKIIGCDKVIA